MLCLIYFYHSQAMKLKIYQVDAFTQKLFGGNPAAICPLESWLPKELMLKIAAENNLSETAFYVKTGNVYDLKWFTPTVEIDLCGHATLASAHVIFNYEKYQGDEIIFNSNSGELKVSRHDQLLTLDFPVDQYLPIEASKELIDGLGVTPVEVYRGKIFIMAVLKNQKEIENLNPDLKIISKINANAILVTAKGESVDFVSRLFAPQSGIDEDPVTGSAHTLLTPYWAAQLNKKIFSAQQLSKRKGDLTCELAGDRVKISGYAKTYLVGEIETE